MDKNSHSADRRNDEEAAIEADAARMRAAAELSRGVYLGDSVYAYATPGGNIRLETRNGLPTDPSNKIYLEPKVLAELVRVAQQVGYPIPDAP